MKHLVKIFLLILIHFLFFSCHSQEKSIEFLYKLDAEPNYKKYSSEDVNHGLNDNSINNFYSSFITSTSTLGWKNFDKVIIDLVITGNKGINKIKIHTIANEKSGVSLPLYVFLFSSNDGIKYELESFKDFSSLKKSKDSLYWLEIDAFYSEKKNLKLVILPSCNYLFIDEIKLSFEQRDNGSSINEINEKLSYSIENTDFDLHLNDIISNSKASVYKQNYQNISRYSSGGIQIIRNKPFGFCKDDFYVDDGENINEQLIGGDYFYSFKIINTGNRNSSITIEDNFNFKTEINLFQVVNVVNNFFSDCEDMLEPIDKNFLLKPNEIKNVYIKVRFNEPITNGIGKFIFKVDEKEAYTLKEKFIIIENHNKVLNIINWAYLDYPQLIKQQEKAIIDLKEHNVNSFVLHRGYLNVNNFDFIKTIEYVRKLRLSNNSKLMLFFNFSVDKNRLIRNGRQIEYLSEDWFEYFGDWYSKLLLTLENEGIKNIYFYPYDELKYSDSKDFEQLTSHLKKQLNDRMKVFVTIDNLKSLEIVDNVDILQIHKRLLNEENLKLIKAKETWLYDIFYYSRDIAPIEYYNLAMLAYNFDLDGIGFWNYSQYLNEEVKYNKFSYSKNTFSVIYNYENNIYTSKRWEAFLAGVNQYYRMKSNLK